MTKKVRHIFGWTAIAITTVFSSLWGFWGIIENFHEGWYYPDLPMNIFLMFRQYMFVSLLFILFGAIGVFFNRIAAVLLLISGVGFCYYIGFNMGATIIILPPVIIIAVLYWFSEFNRKKLALWILAGVPLLVIFVSGIEPVVRLSGRIDDGNYNAREMSANEQKLVFAPEGPGWPNDGVDWYEARRICSRLNRDGLSLADSALNIWRLPTLEELATFSYRHGKLCNGRFDRKAMTARYDIMPDKETPLWKIHSKVIYWWAADEKDSLTAYKYTYNGQIHAMPKRSRTGYHAFRAVKKAL